MAQETIAEKGEWEKIKTEGVVIDDKIWSEIDKRLYSKILRMEELINVEDEEGDIEIEAGIKVVNIASEVRPILLSIIPQSEKESYIENDVIYLNVSVKKLMFHHFGNDIYIICLGIEGHVSDIPPERVPVETKKKVIFRIKEIKNIYKKLKEQTKKE